MNTTTIYFSLKKTGLLLFSFFFLQNAFSQTSYIPLKVTGFNADVVCNSADCSGTSTLDDQWYLYSAEKKAEGAIPQTITSKMDIVYNLVSFDEYNALTIGSNGVSSGTLTLENPVQACELWLLGMSASGQRDVEIVVKYTDNTSSDKINISFSDWHQNSGGRTAVYGLGRVKGNSNYENRYEFGLFERVVPVNAGKLVKSISFSYTGNDKTYTSIFAVSAYTGGERQRDKELYMVSNAHFDTQWDWDVQTSIDQYVKNTLEGNFNLFEKFPNYTFNFEGAIKYMFAKEYYPTLYEKLKGYVASGRWHISGGSIDANDVMVPSAESIIRNFLLGQEFYKKEFGIKGGNDIMLPDCFGFPYTLPTLGKHCGIMGFHSQKLSWGSAYNYDDLPHFNIWQGVDGSQIYAVHKAGAYVNQYRENMSYNGDVLNEIIANKEELGASKTFRYFGTGDRGGSIDENTADWLEKSLASNGPVSVHVVTPDEFFESITPEEHASLPVWDNELPMKTHGAGCYTSQAILKYWNRKNELLADAVEKSSVLADWMGGLPYQSDIIRDNWIRVLWHQFHDDLTGTSIPKAYAFTYNDHVLAQLDFSKTLNNAVGAVTRNMDTQTTGTPIVVYNPLSIDRRDIVEATVHMDDEPVNIRVFDKYGNPRPSQMLKYEDGVLAFIFEANVPSLGYATYDLQVMDEKTPTLSTLKITTETIENESYKLTINKAGNVSSIIDKNQNNKELLKSPIQMTYQSDNPGYWASWEVSWGDVNRTAEGFVGGLAQVSIAEEGPLRSTLKIVRTRGDSKFVQYISMTSGVNADRIDFVNEVDWQSRKTLLKAVFPLTATNEKATYDLSIGTIERGNNKDWLYEVAGHQWADLTHNDDSYGISILNDCKYGWDKPNNNTLRLTLIHTPGVGNERQYEQHQDLGLNKFTYSFYRHMGKWNESTQWEASKLNQPLLAYETPKHGGALGKSFEFVKLNTQKVGIKALKKAEASDDMIVRVYELTGNNHDNVEMTFPANILSATEVNGLEEEVGGVNFTDNKLRFTITKYQPKTFKVKLADYNGTLSEPSSTQLDLAYNIDVMSPDSRKKDGQFIASNYVYPAELFADEILSDGIKFKVGPRDNGLNNAVQCKGQEIDLPHSASNKKVYILAASQNPNGSEVEFLMNNTPYKIKVEYLAEFVGQWETNYASRNYRKENVAFTATHRHNYSQNKNDSYAFLYIYKYTIPMDGNSSKLTLPDNDDVVIFAVTLSDNMNDDVIPVTETYHLPEFTDIEQMVETPCSPKIIPARITAAGSANANERPPMIADGNPYTKWCYEGTSKWIQYTFEKEMKVCQWNVLHAGVEEEFKITEDFRLQRYENNSWIDVDIVTNNNKNQTKRIVEPFVSDRVRLFIDKANPRDNIARIYEFEVFGTNLETAIDHVDEDRMITGNYPNPFRNNTTITCLLPENTNNVVVDVYDISGRIVDTQTFEAFGGYNQIKWKNTGNLNGIYFYKVSAMNIGKVLLQGTGKMIIKL